MSPIEVFTCNATYGDEWLADIESSNPSHYGLIIAIMGAIQDNDGGDITAKDVFEQDPEIQGLVRSSRYRIAPIGGLELKGTGKNIRNVKYSSSKSVAVLWEKIVDRIYITFDDHAPVQYHRAIECFNEIRVKGTTLPKQGRTSRNLLDKMKNPRNRPIFLRSLKKRRFRN